MPALPSGIDPGVADWLPGAVEGAKPPFRFVPITGGRSNLTYAVTDAGGQRWVLRRPPLGRHSGGAHDVLREARLLVGLAGQVPVPRVVAQCADNDVTSAPLFVMDFVDGLIVRTEADARRRLSIDQRRSTGPALIDTLVAIHRADPSPLGLGGLMDRHDYLARQLARWHTNWITTRTRPSSSLAGAHELLTQRAPSAGRVALVHGDFRLDNCVLTADATVRAVLDWELTTVGDPLADLGQFLVYWALPGDRSQALFDPPTLADGFTARTELIDRYCAATDTEPERLDYYLAFNWWKVACIVENVYSRMATGAVDITDRDPESFAQQAADLADHAAELARALQ